MGRVTAVDASSVMLASGTVNLKRFEQRAGETLVLGELPTAGSPSPRAAARRR